MMITAAVRKLIRLAIEEDYGSGDCTSAVAVDPQAQGRASIVARQRLVVCGTPLLPVIADEFGFPVKVTLCAAEGAVVKREEVLATLSGDAQHLLALERIALNFLQRLSGVATYTNAVVRAAKGLTILDTRKTTPGFRYLEKYATRIGGAKNHRMNLGDLILIKNNHIDARGGDVRALLRDVMKRRPPYLPVEVEVRSIDELSAALEFAPSIIMLDNFSDAKIRQALAIIARGATPPLVEISGGITPQRLAKLRELGAVHVSMGALTTQATNVDISMRLSIERSRSNRVGGVA